MSTKWNSKLIVLFSILTVAAMISTCYVLNKGNEPQMKSSIIKVSDGTHVTIYERTTALLIKTFTISVLMGSGGTFSTSASEQFTITSDGTYVTSHCYRPYKGGDGHNIEAVKLLGVPGYPGGLWASIVVDYTLGSGGDASTVGLALGGDYNLTYTRLGDLDSELVLGFGVDDVKPPVADAGGPYIGDEAEPIIFNASASHDPAGGILEYRWDFDNDSSWDTGWMTTPLAHHTWNDDYSGNVTLEVSNGNETDTDTTTVKVNNVAPTITEDISLTFCPTIILRIAGEKWHDVTMYIYEDGIEIGNATIVRYPGNPDDQLMRFEDVCINLTREYTAEIIYTPENDPINGQPNGATPAWIIIESGNASESRIHHTFNVKHPKTWVWEVNLIQHFVGHEFIFAAAASDPGSEDLTFKWNWGDGTPDTETTYFNDPSGLPDPNPSPWGTAPVFKEDEAKHSYASTGTYTITLTVKDDDGGDAVSTMTIMI